MIRFLALGLIATTASGAETFDDAIKRATLNYAERLQKAAEELNRTRERIATEKTPLLQELRATEDRIIAAETAATRMETGHEDATNRRRQLMKDIDGFRKSSTYITTLAHDGLRAMQEGLAPGEGPLWQERIQSLEKALDGAATGSSLAAAVDVAELLLAHSRQAAGGYIAAGRSTLADGNEVVEGSFVFVGPETFFKSAQGGVAGTVRPREGAAHPVTYPLENWSAAEAEAVLAGNPGWLPADPTHGKALRLQQTSGTVLEHVKKGGVVAYAIVVVGFVALILIVQKMRDLSRMAVDSRQGVQAFLGLVTRGSRGEAQAALGSLKASTRELFEEGLRHANEPKAILEERLHAVLLGQRLHFERRLPLLAVIATAAPLMGLLGTVVGMVKTFALITVFGTGNAGKLSSGISEVLVATEIGLAVAIPALVAHGFLAHRIHKNLSMLERHALEFVMAVELSKLRATTLRETEAVTA